MSHVRIVMKDHGRGEVFIDGRKVQDAVSVEFSADASRPARMNRVIIALAPLQVEIEGPAKVMMAPMEKGP